MSAFIIGVLLGAAAVYAARFTWAYGSGYADGAHDAREAVACELAEAMGPDDLRSRGAL